VHAHVGHRVHPQLGGGLHRAEVDEFLAGEEVLLDVAHGVLHPSLLPTRGDVAGGDLEAPMAREVQVLGVEDRRRTDQPLEHGGLQVVDHQPRWHAAEGGEGVLVAGQEELHLLRHGELQVHAPAVAQHHHEEAQAPARVADSDGAELTPVDLRALAGLEVQLEEGRLPARPDAVHVVLDDGDAAGVAGFGQPLVDLLGAVRVGIEPAHDLALEGFELAGARHGPARSELLDLGPPGHGAHIQAQRTRGLRQRELLAHQVVAYAAVGLVVNHGALEPAAAAWPGSRAGHQQRPAYAVPPRCPAGRAPGTAASDRR
jgi:hypothetical protein